MMLELILYKSEVKKVIIGLADKSVYSVLYDITNLGTEYANRTNDLFVTLQLAPAQTQSLDNNKYIGEQDGYWYDMTGRRYSQQPAQTGVYIRNGKKTINY